jgi:hypothetical protein
MTLKAQLLKHQVLWKQLRKEKKKKLIQYDPGIQSRGLLNWELHGLRHR